MAGLPDAVFEVDGDLLVPTELARGPWSPDAQHGGGPAALLARAVESFDPGSAGFVTRLTVELLKPIPLTPLRVSARTTRPGKKVQFLEATMTAGDVEVARATALRVRTDDLGLPRVATEATMGTPADGEPLTIDIPAARASAGIGFWSAMELRAVRGGWTTPGPAAVWFRLRVPVVAGEEPSGLQRAAAAADFGNGISAELERGRHVFINPDLTLHVHRTATGDWVGLDARTAVEPVGVGLAVSLLHDERGTIGWSLQSLLIDRL